MPQHVEKDFIGEREIPDKDGDGARTLRGIETLHTALVRIEPFFEESAT